MKEIIYISVADAKKLISAGAICLDIRSDREFRREHIDGARRWQPQESLPPDSTVIFYCLSGFRTRNMAGKLGAGVDGCRAIYVMEGGINAWKKNGGETVLTPTEPLDVMRQVQIIMGFLVFLGAMLAYFVHPAWLFFVALVGVGFMFAGITGFCGLAKLLQRLPYNRRAESKE